MMRTRTQRAPAMTLLGFAQDHGQRSRLKSISATTGADKKALSRLLTAAMSTRPRAGFYSTITSLPATMPLIDISIR